MFDEYSRLSINKHQYNYNRLFCLVQDEPAFKCYMCICVIKRLLFHSKVPRFIITHFMATPNRRQISEPSPKPRAAVELDGANLRSGHLKRVKRQSRAVPSWQPLPGATSRGQPVHESRDSRGPAMLPHQAGGRAQAQGPRLRQREMGAGVGGGSGLRGSGDGIPGGRRRKHSGALVPEQRRGAEMATGEEGSLAVVKGREETSGLPGPLDGICSSWGLWAFSDLEGKQDASGCGRAWSCFLRK